MKLGKDDTHNHIATVTDAATGYCLILGRIDRGGTSDVMYVWSIHPPQGGGPLEEHESLLFVSDGTGLKYAPEPNPS